MKLEIRIGSRIRKVDIASGDGKPRCTIDGHPIDADAVEIAPGLYSVLIDGRSFEVRVEQSGEELTAHIAGRQIVTRIIDPRQRRKQDGQLPGSEGRQRVTAPMPGKVVRVLVKEGEAVTAGEGIAVVEAMKMQNEIRAPRSGRIERLHVKEGQAVNVGDVLAVVG